MSVISESQSNMSRLDLKALSSKNPTHNTSIESDLDIVPEAGEDQDYSPKAKPFLNIKPQLQPNSPGRRGRSRGGD
jgi:hypothetical protein